LQFKQLYENYRLRAGNVNAHVARGIPRRPILVAAAGFRGNNSLADGGRRGDSAANNFRPKM
jgi:hypothetical protein